MPTCADAIERRPPAVVARVAPAPDAKLDAAPERTSDYVAAASGTATADSARAVHAGTYRCLFGDPAHRQEG